MRAVGGGLVRVLHESASAIASRFGVRFASQSPGASHDTRRNLPLDRHLFNNDLEASLAHDADVVMKVGGRSPRAQSRLARYGVAKFVTANKELMRSWRTARYAPPRTLDSISAPPSAEAPGDIDAAGSRRHGTAIGTGILNGTANFVISHLERGSTLEGALSAARDRGLAEADCSRDLDGSDAAAKLSIIAWIAFGITPSTLHVRRTSLLPGIDALVRCSAALGGRLRLLAECTRLEDDSVVASVEPVIVPESSPFGRTTFEDNRVEVDLGWSSPLSVSGPGAGGAPTAAALLSDLVRVHRRPTTAARRHEIRIRVRHLHSPLAYRNNLDRQVRPRSGRRMFLALTLPSRNQTVLVTRPTKWKRCNSFSPRSTQ
jgi:homoserine dehydrogenase